MNERVDLENRISGQEQLGDDDREHSAHEDADHLVAELDGAVGAQAPACGAVLLHVAADHRADQEDRAGDEADERIGEPREGHHRHADDERRGDRVAVGDADADAVHQHEDRSEQHAKHGIAGRHAEACRHDDHCNAPEHHPCQELSRVDALPLFSHGGLYGRSRAMARQRLSHDQRDVDDRSAEDRAERDQEAHLAPRIVRPEQANLAQPRREREADQADDDRRHADASADDHPGAEGRGGK